MKMLKSAIRFFLDDPHMRSPSAGSFLGLMCSLLLLASSVASAQIPQRRAKRPETVQPVSKTDDKDRAREYEVITAQPLNSIRVQVRYKKEYGYKSDSGVFAGSHPTSCNAFSISAKPDPSVRLDNLIGIHNPDNMQESSGFYVCDFLVKDLPLNGPIRVSVDLANHDSTPFEAWKGGSQAQPPPGQQRMIVDGIRNVTLTETQPRATQVFDMVYAPPPLTPPNQRVPRSRRPLPTR